MGMVVSNITIKMPTKADYNFIKIIFENSNLDDEEHWPVEKYDEKGMCIKVKEVLEIKDTVLGFAKLLDKLLARFAKQAREKGEKDLESAIENISFAMYATTEYANSGEQEDYIIERKDKKLTIRETETYWYFGLFGFEQYEDFCFQVEEICPNVWELLPEEEFSNDWGYAITYDGVYDERPEYGEECLFDEYIKKRGMCLECDD